MAIVLGQELEIEYTAHCYMENSGIGSYEYMGCGGYHKGYDYPELNSDIKWDERLYDTWQNFEIKKISQSDDVINKILKVYQNEKRSY